MKNFFIILFHELKILFKDRQALALLFLMPLALIVFLTFALQDVYQAKIGRPMTLWIVSSENCIDKASNCFLLSENLKRFNYTVRIEKTLDPKDEPELVLVLPQDTEKTIQKLQTQKSLNSEEQMQILFDPLIDQASRILVESHLMLSLQGMLLDRLHKKSKGTPFNTKVTDVSRFEGLVVQKALGGTILPNPIQQTVPAWSLFGMFFILIPLTNSMIRDRHLGVFKRLLSFPISKSSLLIGKVAPFFLINILQFILMFSVGLFILPRLTGLNLIFDFDLSGLIVVTLACASAATSYGLLVSCFAKTSEQAHAFGAFSVVILAIIGGVMIPNFVMPTFMQKIASVSPMNWGLQAYSDLLVRKLSLGAVLPRVYGLLAFSAIACLLSSLRFRWSEDH